MATPSDEKFAIKRVVQNKYGLTTTIYVDALTGRILPSIEGYTLIEEKENTTEPTPLEGSKTEKNSQTEKIVSEEERRNGLSDYQMQSLKAMERNFDNNFGYIDKPGLIGLASFIPGMIGMAGKAANTVVNVNNLMAVNAARTSLGLPNIGALGTVKSVLSDNKGKIGDVMIDGTKYSVSLEPGEKDVTPQEVATFSEVSGSEVTEATKDDKEAPEGTSTNLSFPAPPEAPIGTPLGTSPTPPETKSFAVAPVTKGPDLPDLEPQQTQNNLTSKNSFMSGPMYSLEGKGRNAPPSEELAKAADLAVKTVLGPEYGIEIYSGTYTPEVQAQIDALSKDLTEEGVPLTSTEAKQAFAEIGRIGTSRHDHGQAMDINIIGPNGKLDKFDPLNQDEFQAVAEEFGRQGIQSLGFGKGYMGSNHFHVDLHTDRAPTWGTGFSSVNQAFLDQRTPVGVLPFENPPTPFGRFTPTQREAEDHSLASLAAFQEFSPVDRSPEVLDQMALTIAGELGTKTYDAIRSGNPEAIQEAKQEIASIAATIDNRAQSSRFASLDDPYSAVMTPSQYNSLTPGNMMTTNSHYSNFGDFIKSTITDYDQGVISPVDPNATHYYNPSIVTPSWADYAPTGFSSVGEHVFGTVNIPGTSKPEYSKTPEPTPSFVQAPESRPTLSSDMGFIGGHSSVSNLGIPGTSGTFGDHLSFEAPTTQASFASFSPADAPDYANTGFGFNPTEASTMGQFGQSMAGVTAENIGTGIGPQAMSAQSSFGGFNVGTLDGSGFGFGEGFGVPTTEDTGFNSFSNSSGTVSMGPTFSEGVLGSEGRTFGMDFGPSPAGITAPSTGLTGNSSNGDFGGGFGNSTSVGGPSGSDEGSASGGGGGFGGGAGGIF